MTEKAKRLELDEELRTLLGTRNVYFQPPESVKLKYPAIIYKRSIVRSEYADNGVYKTKRGYQIIAIDKDPDSALVDKLAVFPCSRHISHYVSDNLNHDVFELYY